MHARDPIGKTANCSNIQEWVGASLLVGIYEPIFYQRHELIDANWVNHM